MRDPDKTSNRELRQFGLILGSLLALLFGLLFPFIGDEPFPLWPWIAAAVVVTPAIIAPALLGPLFWAWMKAASVVNWIVTRLVLSIVLYLVMFPFGIIMKMTGRDALARRWSAETTSYRTPSQKRAPDHMEKPF